MDSFHKAHWETWADFYIYLYDDVIEFQSSLVGVTMLKIASDSFYPFTGYLLCLHSVSLYMPGELLLTSISDC